MDFTLDEVDNLDYINPNITEGKKVDELKEIIRNDDFMRRQNPREWSTLRKPGLIDFINRHIQVYNTTLRERKNERERQRNNLEIEDFFDNFNDYDFEIPRERKRTGRKIRPNRIEIRRAFGGIIEDVTFRNDEEFDMYNHLNIVKIDYPDFIFENNHSDYKISLCTEIILFDTRTDETREEPFYIKSNTHIINRNNYLEVFDEMVNEILHAFEERITESTQYRFESIIKTIMEKAVYQPLRGGSYIKMDIGKRCINIQNKNDNYCILYVILYFLHKDELLVKPERASKYQNWLNDVLNDDKFKSLNISFPFPVTSQNVKLLEDYFNITMNVFKLESDKTNIFDQIAPYYLSESFEADKNKIHVDTLHTTKDENSHFVVIPNLSGFFNGTIFHQKRHLIICKKCFKHTFKTEALLIEHQKTCYSQSNGQLIQNFELPVASDGEKPGNNIKKYETNGAEAFHHFVSYIDFEAFLEKCDIKKKNTNLISKHVPNSFGIYNNYFKIYDNHLATEEKLTENLHLQFSTLAKNYYKNILSNKKDKIEDAGSLDKFDKTDSCELCHIKFNSESGENYVKKCFDHDHVTGKYRMALCNDCNINKLRDPLFIPIIAHNLKSYDSKFILKELDKIDKLQTASFEIKVIANSIEKYRQFTKKIKVDEELRKKCLNSKCNYAYNFPNVKKCYKCNKTELENYGLPIYIELRFIDSFEFIPTSLDKAIKNLLNLNGAYCNHCKKVREIKNCNFEVIEDKIYVNDICNFCNIGKQIKQVNYEHLTNFNHVFKDSTKEEICFLLRKGVYPYEFMDSMDKLNLTELPKYDDFHSKLSGNISKSDYEFAQKLWNYFKKKNNGNWTLKDYHLLYLQLDVILLADVYDNFREMCYKNYGLDPIHFVSAPHLSFNAALKYTRQQLELITEEEKYVFFEKGVRGGISQIIHSYEKANNCYFYDDKVEKVYKLSKEDAEKKGIYDPKKLTSYIMYLDANNLYGSAMSEKLPVNNHEWLTEEQIQYFSNPENVLNFDSDVEKCINIEVDLEIPENLHNFFNDYAPAPNHESSKILSSFQHELIEKKLGSNKKTKYQKLLCTLEKKENYIINIKLLQEYLKNGVKLLKIHRGISSNQEAWLKPYIEKNTELRKKANNDFEKDFFKLMNNSVFGKQMENVRNRCNFRLINRADMMQKLVNKNKYQNRHIIDDNLVIMSGRNETIKLNKPIFGGMCVLDLSKLLMFKFFVKMKKKYGDRFKLLGTDTDSFICYFEAESMTHDFDIYQDMKDSIDDYDTSDLIENFPLEGLKSDANKKTPGKFKDEYNGIPIREFCGLRSKMYSFKTDNSDKKVCKGIKKINIKGIRFEDYKKCIDTLEPKMEEIYNIRSFKLGLFTTKETKIGLSPYDDKFYMFLDENKKIQKLAHGHYKIKKMINNEPLPTNP